MFICDTETLDIESTAVVLSTAIIYFDEKKLFTLQDLIDNSIFVKFSVDEQVKNYKRTIDKDTVDWWRKQNAHAIRKSFTPSSLDISALEGMTQLRNFVTSYESGSKQVMFARGNLDQMVLDSLARKMGIEPVTEYYNWRDVRTAVECLTTTAKNGYCDIDPAHKLPFLDKHDPVNDCVIDAFMIKYGV